MRSRLSNWFHPVTRRRWQRFRGLRRAWWSFWILLAAYVVSLFSEWLCNDKPLLVVFEGRTHVPILRYTSERDLLGEGHQTRADFKALQRSERFQSRADNKLYWPLIPHGPREIVKPDRIALPDLVTVRLVPQPRVATIQVSDDGKVGRGVAAGVFFGTDDGGETGRSINDGWVIPNGIRDGLLTRFRNEPSPEAVGIGRSPTGQEVELSLSPFTPRSAPPRTVRLTLRDASTRTSATITFPVTRDGSFPSTPPPGWSQLTSEQQQRVGALAAQRFTGRVDAEVLDTVLGPLRVEVDREEVRYPFRPVSGHPLGLDSAGRDVLARMLYGLRTAMTFGLLLTLVTLLIGTLFGALQGYYGGPVDLVGQRVIEIWDALPFLYILMLMGSVFGRSFLLLLVCYGLFNWIGISYYVRAEFLRLRRQPFVEAARALGLPGWKIMYRHILPNALVPLITFFPFSLVSAIGTLAALDFLGFGLPPPTPSWGDLLAQAQEYKEAWWLALYPSLGLFVVMLLGVFVGEGVRQAFDPKPYGRME